MNNVRERERLMKKERVGEELYIQKKERERRGEGGCCIKIESEI